MCATTVLFGDGTKEESKKIDTNYHLLLCIASHLLFRVSLLYSLIGTLFFSLLCIELPQHHAAHILIYMEIDYYSKVVGCERMILL